MSKLVRNILITLAASIGFVAVVVGIMYMLGYDVPCLDKCICKCTPTKKYPSRKTSSATPTKIKRHYTKLDLEEA